MSAARKARVSGQRAALAATSGLRAPPYRRASASSSAGPRAMPSRRAPSSRRAWVTWSARGCRAARRRSRPSCRLKRRVSKPTSPSRKASPAKPAVTVTAARTTAARFIAPSALGLELADEPDPDALGDRSLEVLDPADHRLHAVHGPPAEVAAQRVRDLDAQVHPRADGERAADLEAEPAPADVEGVSGLREGGPAGVAARHAERQPQPASLLALDDDGHEGQRRS